MGQARRRRDVHVRGRGRTPPTRDYTADAAIEDRIPSSRVIVVVVVVVVDVVVVIMRDRPPPPGNGDLRGKTPVDVDVVAVPCCFPRRPAATSGGTQPPPSLVLVRDHSRLRFVDDIIPAAPKRIRPIALDAPSEPRGSRRGGR